MKKQWLRGVLLGVSIALLLSGGVALAQGLFVTADKECVECWPGPGEPTEDRYLLELTVGGWDTRYLFCRLITIDGEILQGPSCGPEYFPEDPWVETDWFPCEWGENNIGASLLGHEVVVANGPPDLLGEWVIRLWQENPPGTEIDSASVSFLVAEVCEAEFVPEPGTVLLLGSGLVGLAGYATLRWRARE